MNESIILQGGIFPDSYGYNDFEFYDSSSTLMNSVKILERGKVNIDIKIIAKYPHPYQFSYLDTLTQSGYSSSYFFVGKRNTRVRIRNLSTSRTVLIGRLSKENKEYLQLQRLYKKFDEQTLNDSSRILGKLEVLDRYILKKPNSFIALWDLALFYPTLREGSYKRIVMDAIINFSTNIKESKTYKALEDNIAHDLRLEKGNNFPNIILGNSDSLLKIASRNKFTLIDFWFSSCVPCLNQFEALNQIYEKQKERNFEIVGISTDSEKLVDRWSDVISKFNITWINLLDTNGIEANKLFIRKFPTNFLIDSNGKILEKDITPSDLDLYLKKNL